MRIAIVPTLNPSYGGSLQYSLALLSAAATISRSTRTDTWNVFVRLDEREHLRDAEFSGQTVVYGSIRDRLVAASKRLLGSGALLGAMRFLRERGRKSGGAHDDGAAPDKELLERLIEGKTDWILFTAPETRFVHTPVPYVMPVFDLQHRLQPEFPEVSADGEWECREELYRTIARSAAFILADSEVGKEDILRYYGQYGATADRIKVLPYVPAPYLSTESSPKLRARVRKRYRLPERYFFYPAQFWPHKNHLRIVQAMGRLKEEGDEVHLVLTGASNGKFRRDVFRSVMEEAVRLGIERQIHYLGYVRNEAMRYLYLGADALVMPTFFGPTNIPVLEAWLFRCPVLTSDIRGIREQVGDAGILVDPTSVESIAAGLHTLWNDAEVRLRLSALGEARLAGYGPAEMLERLESIVADVDALLERHPSGLGSDHT